MSLRESSIGNFRKKVLRSPVGRAALGFAALAVLSTACASDQKANEPNPSNAPFHSVSPGSSEVITYPDPDIVIRNFTKDTINPGNPVFKSLESGVKVVPMKGWTGEYKTIDGDVDAYIPFGTGEELNLLFKIPGTRYGARGIPLYDTSEEEMLSFAKDLFKEQPPEWERHNNTLPNGNVMIDRISYSMKDGKSEKEFVIDRNGTVSLKVVYH